MTRAVHIPCTVEPDQDRAWCAMRNCGPERGPNGEGDSREAAIADLREALEGLIAEFGPPQELTLSKRCSLTLRAGTVVDVGVLCEWAARVVDGSASQDDLRAVNWRSDAMDLLPGWYDDWVIFERERIRQRLLHALEALSQLLVAAGRCADAVEAAISAVSVDPLRESANRALIEAHLAEGNLVEARRAYERYREVIRRELGVEPGERLARLVRAGFLPQSVSRPPGRATHSSRQSCAHHSAT
jgi:DNA-binding SARP family transcriptional activator